MDNPKLTFSSNLVLRNSKYSHIIQLSLEVMMLRTFLSFLFLIAVCTGAQAGTSIYTDSSAHAWPNAINASNWLGSQDGVSALIPDGGWIAYQVSTSFTALDFYATVSAITGPGTSFFYVGTSNGAGWFSGLNSVSRSFAATPGKNVWSTTATQETYCAGQGGCDVFIIQAWNGSSLSFDSVIAANPEPTAWALMLLGFTGVAWRLKDLKRRGQLQSLASRSFARV